MTFGSNSALPYKMAPVTLKPFNPNTSKAEGSLLIKPIANAAALALPSAAALSSDKAQNINFFYNPLCDLIIQIWRTIYVGLEACFSQVYRTFVANADFPMVNSDLSEEGRKKMYWGLGKENKWRECIDGRYHDLNDKYCFDKGSHRNGTGTCEPGFIKSMEEAFDYIGSSLGRKIDAEWYLSLHRHTAKHFKGPEKGTQVGQEKVGVFRNLKDYPGCYLVGVYALTKEAEAEFKSLDQALKDEFGSTYGLGKIVKEGTKVRIDYELMRADQVECIFNKFLAEFYNEIDRAKTADQKLWAVARLQQRLEWLHPVADGTSRTSTAAMNKLLVEIGFHPAILEYPHLSTSYGLGDWKAYLQKGLIKWEQERQRIEEQERLLLNQNKV